MTPERWQRVEEVYHALVGRPEREQSDLMVRLCGDDTELRAEVESLLGHVSGASGFLETPVTARAAEVFTEEQSLVGRRVGPFIIGPLLGAGGMGEVYRAHDTQLSRDIALKILRRPFWNDPDRRDRFQREARILAALNHPNIASIYGHAEIDDSPALVLELVDGETLAERMTRPIALSETLKVARAITDALEAAHERGIIHRDLKPANIKITSDGIVKVLDFGLAKLAGETPARPETVVSPSHPQAEAGTQDGVLLGTPAYMSPEQAAGRPADKRSDLWAFGVVVLEMLTGRQAFIGDSDAAILASVQESQPDFSRLPPDTPVAIHRLLRRCLEKDRKRRLDSASAARWEIDDALAAPNVEPVRAEASSSPWHVGAMAAFAGVAALVALLALLWRAQTSETPGLPSRFAIVTPPAQPLNVASSDRDLALSPDGRYLVYRAIGSTTYGSPLFLRAIDQIEARPIGDVHNAYTPFFSPDSRWVGFFERGMLKKVSVTGGPVFTLGPVTGGPLGGSWGDDNTIVFATDHPDTGLWRVSADGGNPVVITKPDPARQESDHTFPSLLPGARGVLFTITAESQPAKAQIAWLDLRTGEQRTLMQGGNHAEYVEQSAGVRGGHLVYAAQGTLRAVRFDPVRLEVSDHPVTVVDHVMIKPNGAANFATSRTGTLVYVPEGAATPTPITTLTWVDRSGREEAINAPPRAYGPPRVAPDGFRIAVAFPDQGDTEIWILDTAGAIPRRLTFNPGMDGLPSWTPDGQRIIFMSGRAGPLNWYSMAADGSGAVSRLTTSPTHEWPISVTPDGDRIFGFEVATASTPRVVTAQVTDSSTGRPLAAPQRVQGLFQGVFPEISPNGRYLAYQSDESGQEEIYVRSYPLVDEGRWQISTRGGTRAAWSRNGRELFFLDASNTLIAVSTDTSSPTFVAGTPTKVFETKYVEPNPARHYDVSPDGRFLVLKPRAADENATPASMVVVERWVEELKRRVP